MIHLRVIIEYYDFLGGYDYDVKEVETLTKSSSTIYWPRLPVISEGIGGEEWTADVKEVNFHPDGDVYIVAVAKVDVKSTDSDATREGLVENGFQQIADRRRWSDKNRNFS